MTDTHEQLGEDVAVASGDAWDAALDAVMPEETVESETSEQPRDEHGRYATTGEGDADVAESASEATSEEAPAEATEGEQTPTEAAAEAEAIRRAFKVKLDHEEREVDLDALWSTEEGRAELRERYEKGYGFDRAVERAKQEALQAGQRQTLTWLESRGYKVAQNPMSGQWEIQAPQAAIPAAGTTPPDATPAPDRAALEHTATYGDEADPAAQIRAIRELARLDAEEAANAKFKVFEDWKAQQAQQAQQAHAGRQREAVEQRVLGTVQSAIEARVKSFDGPDRDRQIQRVTALAMSKARTDARSMDEVLAIVTEAADDLDARREFWKREAATPPPAAKTPTPKPTPSLDGVPAGTSKGSARGKKLTGWNDPRLDEILGG